MIPIEVEHWYIVWHVLLDLRAILGHIKRENVIKGKSGLPSRVWMDIVDTLRSSKSIAEFLVQEASGTIKFGLFRKPLDA